MLIWWEAPSAPRDHGIREAPSPWLGQQEQGLLLSQPVTLRIDLQGTMSASERHGQMDPQGFTPSTWAGTISKEHAAEREEGATEQKIA
jgi:hypothetical protein